MPLLVHSAQMCMSSLSCPFIRSTVIALVIVLEHKTIETVKHSESNSFIKKSMNYRIINRQIQIIIKIRNHFLKFFILQLQFILFYLNCRFFPLSDIFIFYALTLPFSGLPTAGHSKICL